ncbi:MAG: hypothetical protein EBR99_02135, partial [Actinobacteria bacterium]|nr:hypothetical protein [Actinomycetota bacterium]
SFTNPNGSNATGGTLTKVGTGILTLSGSTSAWTNGTNVNGGVLRLGASGVLSTTGTMTIANAAGPSQLELSPTFTQTLAAITFGGSGAGASSQGNVLIGSTATLTLGGTTTFTSTSNPLGAVISGSGSLSTGSASKTFTIGNSTATDVEITISTPITSTGGITLGAGTAYTNAGNLLSSGDNTYTGTTQINGGAGTLTFKGNNASMSGVTTLYGGVLALDYTTNNNRKISSGILTLVGGSIVATGNASATTADTVASTTLASGGRSSITLNSGSGQALNFTLGTITRAAGAGTLRVTLPTSGSLSIGATANPTAGYLPYAAVNTASGYMFGTVSSGTLIAYSSTATDAIGSWSANQNVTDTQSSASSVYSGTLAAPGLSINSLRFNAAGTSTVAIANNVALNIAGGGVMTTSAVGANAASITGGYLTSTAAELVFLQDNTSQAFTVSSRIIGSTAVTMGGTGGLTNANLTLNSASNYFTGTTTISGGTLQVSGGNAIGDTSPVTFANSGSNPTLSLGASVTETIGSLSGGGTTGGTISLGSAAVLTINQTSGLTFSGFLNSNTNSNAKIIKSGSGTLTVDQAVGANYNGIFEISQGQVTFSGNVNQLAAVTSLILSGPTAVLSLLNDQTSAVGSRIFDTATVTLSNTAGALGLYMSRTAGTTTGTETVGPLTLNAGQNTITADGTAASRIAAIKFTNATPLVRNNYSTALLLARNFDTTSTQGGRIVFSVTPGGAIGGAGAAASTTISIFPYFIGENTAAAPVAATNVGNSFVMFVDGTLGVRPLNLTTEYVVDSAAPATGTNNVRYTVTNAITTPAAINSLVLDSAAGVALTGSVSSMEITSGAILAAGTGSSSISTLTGLTSGATPVPYHVYVTNASGVLTLNTPLTSAAPLVKSGAGTLVLSSASNAFTDLYLNLGTVQADALNKLGSGALNFFGGTLKFGAAFDATSGPKTILIGTGGATFDTNGFSPTFANAIGNSGAGSLTKIGTGTLTLNGAASYTGATTVSAGTLAIGVNSAIGTGALTVSSAATLAMGAFNATISGLTLSAASANVISGSGTLTVNGDATLNQGSIAPVLAGTMNLLKTTASQTVTLSNAASTFTGLTWIQDGTLSVTALADAGANSSLGAATGANAGILIGNGASTTATLAYSSASSSSSNRAILLAGTTGGATIDSGA